MKVLALDTAMNGCAVAVWDAAAGAAAIEVRAMARGHAEALVPLLQTVLVKAQLDFPDLDLIATTVGPGAFTGLRIGLSTARALGLALEIPVIGVTTLEVLAASYFKKSQDQRNVLVLIETKRSDFYGQLFSASGSPLSEPFALPAVAISELYLVGNLNLIGDANHRFLSLLDESDRVGVFAIDGFEIPDPLCLAALAQARFASGDHLTPADPLYLRGADVSQSKKVQRKIAE